MIRLEQNVKLENTKVDRFLSMGRLKQMQII